MLQDRCYCGPSFNFLIHDGDIPGLVNLESVDISEILTMVKEFENVLQQLVSSTAQEFERSMPQLFIEHAPKITLSGRSIPVSYSGAHLQDFLAEHGRRPRPAYTDLLEVFRNDWARDSKTLTIKLQRRDLKCLGPFLGTPIWVFASPGTTKPEKFHPKTTMTDLASIWGPL
ncbi:hypothetical protein NHQ30_007435 [Ciborinia camelliae]|nr:hypothetical protein NHQ30_007435 [Ciborinia camelliae]